MRRLFTRHTCVISSIPIVIRINENVIACEGVLLLGAIAIFLPSPMPINCSNGFVRCVFLMHAIVANIYTQQEVVLFDIRMVQLMVFDVTLCCWIVVQLIVTS